MNVAQPAIIFDLVGVIFYINKLKFLKKLGFARTACFYIRYGINPFDYGLSMLDYIRRHVAEEYQDVLNLNGVYLPKVMCLWQEGHLGTAQVFEKIKVYFEQFLDKKVIYKEADRQLLFCLFSMIFDPAMQSEILMPIAKTVRSLHLLKKKSLLFALSNIDHETYAIIAKKHEAIFQLFDGIVTSCDTSLLKPQEDIFLYLLKEYALIPGQCYFIDDQQENIKTATALGINGILYTKNINLEKLFRKINFV